MSRRCRWTVALPALLGLGACFPFLLDTGTLVQCVTDADCQVGTICSASGNCVAATPTASSSGGSSASSQGSAVSSSGGSSSGGTPTASSSSGSSSGGTPTASSSSGSSSGGPSSTGSSSSSGSGCSGTSAAPLPPRVLVTVDSTQQGGVWDVTSPAAAAELIGPANLLSDSPLAVAQAVDQEILVLMDTNGLVAFSGTGTYLGQIQVPVPSGMFQGGSGLAYVPQPCGGTPVVIVCGNEEVTAFGYPGSSAFSNGMYYPNAIYSDQSDYNACVPGPGNTYFATSPESVGWYDVLTGCPHVGGCNGAGTGTFATSQGDVNGVAVDPSGNVLVVGDDGAGDGFAALFNPSGVCTAALSGGACSLTCGVCTPGNATLSQTPLYAAAYFNGAFLVTASTTNTPAMNNVWQVTPGNPLTLSTYYTGPANTDFYGIFAAPQPP